MKTEKYTVQRAYKTCDEGKAHIILTHLRLKTYDWVLQESIYITLEMLRSLMYNKDIIEIRTTISENGCKIYLCNILTNGSWNAKQYDKWNGLLQPVARVIVEW